MKIYRVSGHDFCLLRSNNAHEPVLIHPKALEQNKAKKNAFRAPSKARQQGIALVVGLILLLVITLLGITAIRATTQQERMAANSQQQAQTFQSAEQAIRQLMTVRLRTAPVPPAQSYLYNALNNLTPNSETTAASTYGTSSTAVLTYTGTQIAPNSSLGGSNCCVAYQFLITSTATQTGTNAYEQHLQGIQRLGPNP